MENPPFWRCFPYWKWELSIAMLVFKSVWYTYNTYNLRCPWQPGVSSKMAPYCERILRRYNVPFPSTSCTIYWVTPNLGWNIISHHTFGKNKKKNINQLKNSIFRGIRAIWYLFVPPARETFFFHDQAVSRFILASEDPVDTFLAGFNSFNLGTNFSAGAAFCLCIYLLVNLWRNSLFSD